MNVGVREPKTFNRWLILGADTSYWAVRVWKHYKTPAVAFGGRADYWGRDQVVDDTRKLPSG